MKPSFPLIYLLPSILTYVNSKSLIITLVHADARAAPENYLRLKFDFCRKRGRGHNEMTKIIKQNAKPRFELCANSCRRAHQHSLPARGRCARYRRKFSFARYHDEAVSVLLHGSAMGNKSRPARSASPAAEGCEKVSAFGIEGQETTDCCA